MTTQTTPTTTVADRVQSAIAERRADEQKQLDAVRQELQPTVARAAEILSEIAAAVAETDPVFSKLRVLTSARLAVPCARNP